MRHKHAAMAIFCLVTLQALAGEETDAFRRVKNSEDVAWLEKVAGSMPEAVKLVPATWLGHDPRILRTLAYARLGELGTPKSLAAVNRIEEGAGRAKVTPEKVTIGLWTHPCWHYGDEQVLPLAQVKGQDGKTYAVVRSSLLGESALFLISTSTPDDPRTWSRPRLIPQKVHWSIREPSLQAKDKDTLLFAFVQEKPTPSSMLGRQEYQIDLAEVLRDSDGDGWTDLEEARLGLDPNSADTDRDGIKDGQDVTPGYAPAESDNHDEEVEIIQKAIFATLGLSGSRHLLLVVPKSRKVQLWGYGGPVIYCDDRKKWKDDGPVFIEWHVKKEGLGAVVTIDDYVRESAAGDQRVTLKKIGGKWFVVKSELGSCS